MSLELLSLISQAALWFYIMITVVISSVLGLSFRDNGMTGALPLFTVLGILASVAITCAWSLS